MTVFDFLMKHSKKKGQGGIAFYVFRIAVSTLGCVLVITQEQIEQCFNEKKILISQSKQTFF